MNIIKSFIFSVLAASLIAGGVFIVNKANFEKELDIVIGEKEQVIQEKEDSFKAYKEQVAQDEEKRSAKLKQEQEKRAQEHKEQLAKLKEQEEKKRKEEAEKLKGQIKEQEKNTRLLAEDNEFKEGELLISSNKYNDAITAFEKFDSSKQLYHEAQLKIASIHAYLGNKDEALKHAKNAAKGDATTAAKAQAISNAYAKFESARDSGPEYKEALLAASFLETAQLNLAREKAKQIILTHPEYKDAHILLGLTLFAEKNYNQAIAALAPHTPLQNPRGDYYLGLAYNNVGNHKASATHLELALEGGFTDDLKELKTTLADAHNYSGNHTRAAEVYEEVIKEFNPEISYYLKPIILYIEKLAEPKKATALGKYAIDKHHKEALAYNLAGWAQLSAGDLKESAKLLDKAIDIDPELAAAYLNYGHLYVKQKEYEIAKQYYQRAIDRSPDNSIGIRARDEINKILTGFYN